MFLQVHKKQSKKKLYIGATAGVVFIMGIIFWGGTGKKSEPIVNNENKSSQNTAKKLVGNWQDPDGQSHSIRFSDDGIGGFFYGSNGWAELERMN